MIKHALSLAEVLRNNWLTLGDFCVHSVMKNQTKAYRRESVSRKKWRRPTMKMLVRELSVTTDPRQRAVIKQRIEEVRNYCKSSLPQAVTYYPDRTKKG